MTASGGGAGPTTAIILGSGAWHVLRRGGFALEGGEARQTPFGPSAPVYRASLPGGEAALLLARHGAAGYEAGAWAVNYRANVWALKDLGAETIVATSACGGIDGSLDVGTFVVPHDVLDKTTGRAKTFFEGSGLGVLRSRDPFCPSVRGALVAALAGSGAAHREAGVYVTTDGPRLETPAEIRVFASEGATVVGMTLSPEWSLARELEMCYAALCWVVNPAEGVKDRPYRPDVLFEGMATPEEGEAADASAERLPAILAAALGRVGPERPCYCRRAMERYKRRGEIGDDFRTWIS